MRRNKTIQPLLGLLVLVFLLTGTPLQGLASTELEEFLEAIQGQADTIGSMEADFVQEKHLALFTQPVMFTGEFALVKPDRLRWEFTSPIPSVLILNRDHAIRCNDQAAPETTTLSSDPIMKGVADQLWMWLGGGYQQLKEQYAITKTADFSLHIVPLSQPTSSFIDYIEIVFEPKTLLPAEVSIFEPGGDKTRISFTNNRINPEIPAALFTSCDHVR